MSDLARRYPISSAAVHKDVGALERAGLVTKRRHGREQRAGLADGDGQIDELLGLPARA